MITEAQKIIQAAQKLTNKFILKCETGKARSVETLADCRSLLNMITKYEEGRKDDFS